MGTVLICEKVKQKMDAGQNDYTEGEDYADAVWNTSEVVGEIKDYKVERAISF